MKKTIIILTWIFLYYPLEHAQLLTWKKLLGSQTSNFNTIATDSGSNTLYLVNSHNLLIRTSNNGATFDSVHSSTYINIYSLLPLGQGVLFAGHMGNLGVLKSTNNGTTWESKYPFWGISELFYDGKRIWGGNVDGQIIYSSDFGNTWSTLNFSANKKVVSILSDSPYVFIGTYYGGYFRSSNYGETWYQIPNVSGPGFICEDKNKNFWFISGDYMLHSSDFGNSWLTISNLSHPKYLAIDDFDNLYYSGWDGLYKSKNGGTSWNLISVFRPQKIAFIDSTIFLMDYFELYAYLPGHQYIPGKNMWPLTKGNQYQYLNYSSFIDGYSYSLGAKIVTKDTLIDQVKYHGFDNSGIFFKYDKDSNKAFSWYNGTDGLYCDFNLPHGSSFLQYSPIPNTYHQARVYVDSQSIFGILRKTFEISTTSGNGQFYEKFGENLGIIAKGNYFSGPGLSSETNSSLINAILYDSTGNYEYYSNNYLPEIIFQPFSNLNGNILHTFSSEVKHYYNRYGYSVGSIREGILYIDSVFVEFYYQKDLLITPNQKSYGNRTPITDYYNFSILVDTSLIRNGYKLIYRIGAKDKSIIPVYKYSPDSGFYQADYNPTLVNDEEIYTNSFSLSQNYPNPFNPSTKIKYSIPAVGTQRAVSVQLKVFDVLGNEVATLVDEYKPAGSYEVEFNASSGIGNMASGIYFYQLKTGDFIETKKMILLR